MNKINITYLQHCLQKIYNKNLLTPISNFDLETYPQNYIKLSNFINRKIFVRTYIEWLKQDNIDLHFLKIIPNIKYRNIICSKEIYLDELIRVFSEFVVNIPLECEANDFSYNYIKENITSEMLVYSPYYAFKINNNLFTGYDINKENIYRKLLDKNYNNLNIELIPIDVEYIEDFFKYFIYFTPSYTITKQSLVGEDFYLLIALNR